MSKTQKVRYRLTGPAFVNGEYLDPRQMKDPHVLADPGLEGPSLKLAPETAVPAALKTAADSALGLDDARRLNEIAAGRSALAAEREAFETDKAQLAAERQAFEAKRASFAEVQAEHGRSIQIEAKRKADLDQWTLELAQAREAFEKEKDELQAAKSADAAAQAQAAQAASKARK